MVGNAVMTHFILPLAPTDSAWVIEVGGGGGDCLNIVGAGFKPFFKVKGPQYSPIPNIYIKLRKGSKPFSSLK